MSYFVPVCAGVFVIPGDCHTSGLFASIAVGGVDDNAGPGMKKGAAMARRAL
jgi:hypothetical protein